MMSQNRTKLAGRDFQHLRTRFGLRSGVAGLPSDMNEPLIDEGRDPAVRPGYLVYSAKINESALACFLRCRCGCGAAGTISKRTFIDVYSNGVLVNMPSSALCCCWSDNARFVYFDKWGLGTPQEVGVCNPAPYCCPHCCNLCGDTIGFKRAVGCPLNIGHWAYVCGCCCPLDVFVGLEKGEGLILAGKINEAKEKFIANGNKSPPYPRSGLMMGEPEPTASGGMMGMAPGKAKEMLEAKKGMLIGKASGFLPPGAAGMLASATAEKSGEADLL